MPARLLSPATALSVLACAVATFTATVTPASAGCGGHPGAAPGPYGPPPHVRPCPPPPYAGRPYGPPPIVSGYLPRNNNLPMYNEPPPRLRGE